ncbi:hypothetical protein CYLTODRAFT_441546 [Cylindrobasidium torrendii FP15055 ss-10]|uniref:Uncharacterized protein n=1 Tax=Cylindrobasidium torrendii FP15055 ss-10 TaxID=1314674 RepID=A0A0D7BKH0_9AGAR|nr:hypothetical protein CYLTODRAFT_441546 [Cylindrobasidium torrendii FP15055 ss-10]
MPRQSTQEKKASQARADAARYLRNRERICAANRERYRSRVAESQEGSLRRGRVARSILPARGLSVSSPELLRRIKSDMMKLHKKMQQAVGPSRLDAFVNSLCDGTQWEATSRQVKIVIAEARGIQDEAQSGISLIGRDTKESERGGALCTDIEALHTELSHTLAMAEEVYNFTRNEKGQAQLSEAQDKGILEYQTMIDATPPEKQVSSALQTCAPRTRNHEQALDIPADGKVSPVHAAQEEATPEEGRLENDVGAQDVSDLSKEGSGMSSRMLRLARSEFRRDDV